MGEPNDLIARALVALEPDIRAKIQAMPPEEQQVASGICLWLNGYSYRKASIIAGCSTTVLFERVKGLRNDSEQEINQSLSNLAPVYGQLSLEVARQQLEAVIDPDQKHSLAQLTITGGVATDKIVNIARLQSDKKETKDGLASFFDQLAKRGVRRVSLDIEEPAIDVTPKKETP